MGSWFVCALVFLASTGVTGQPSRIQPSATDKDCICKQDDPICYCTLRIEHKLTMILEKEKELVYPDGGKLKFAGGPNKMFPLTAEQTQRVITADGERSRLVITVNGVFPGPRIETYKDQELHITVINLLHTDSVTVHFHGIHQKGTPHMDGMAFLTQCPILPGQTFVHKFKAYPPGTAMYHAHIGDQRTMGLYGPFIVRNPANSPLIRAHEEIIIALQDWNHLMDAETAYQRMLTEQFDFNTNERIPTTRSVDGGKFSRFEFQSGLVNGKGRFYKYAAVNNGAPLERFEVQTGRLYRIRVIGAATLYPMRFFIEGQKMILYGSDGFNLEQVPVESIIVHPGERYDVLWTAPSVAPKREILFVAETIETPESLLNKYHAAEAVLEFVNHGASPNPNPPMATSDICTTSDKCVVFNCPYLYYPPKKRSCLTFDDVKNNDPIRNPKSILGNGPVLEKFFNFGFPGVPGNTPGSVNGRQLVFPTSTYLTHPSYLERPCEQFCNNIDICECTYVEELEPDRVVQFVFTNIGNGSGWSHPIHLHGHSFYVMKMGFGSYDPASGVLLRQTNDVNCTDRNNYCTTIGWTNSSWYNGNVPDISDDPPEKDTIIVPTGGYVVVRFISDNPGVWFLHCHIDLHNTNGMGMLINEAPKRHPPMPRGFPTCGSFYHDGREGPTCGVNGQTLNIFVFLASVLSLAFQ